MMTFDDFVQVFNHLDSLPWNCDVDNRQIFEIAKLNFANLCFGHTKNRKLVRVIGQSGSGKTTQLLPAAKAIFERDGLLPIEFAVRDFVKLHPDFDRLRRTLQPGEIREITNGFALRCLVVSLALAIEMGFDVLLEVTLLSREFEKFVFGLLEKNAYDVLFLCVAASKETSDRFIELRKNSAGSSESGRIVLRTSADFFFDTLEVALRFYAEKCTFRIVIWNVCDKLPVFDGKISDCLDIFLRERKKHPTRFFDENALRDAKICYVVKNA